MYKEYENIKRERERERAENGAKYGDCVADIKSNQLTFCAATEQRYTHNCTAGSTLGVRTHGRTLDLGASLLAFSKSI